jgi:hypothetical protein
MMKIAGQGMWIWIIDSCENGDIDAIVRKAKEHNIKFIMPKATNGIIKYKTNWELVNGKPKIVALAEAAHAAGIAVVPWGWVFGRSPYSPYASLSTLEAQQAVQAVAALNADGWIIDAEHDWKRPELEMWREVDKYMDELESGLLREGFADLPVFVSTYRYPQLHRTFPFETWKNRLRPERGDGWMPQVYWEQDYRTEAGKIQLQLTFAAYKDFLNTNLNFIPAGAAYKIGGWVSMPEQIRLFYEEAISMGVPASLWDWQHMTDVIVGNGRWEVCKDVWGGVIIEPEEPEEPEDPTEPEEPEEPSDPEEPFLRKVVITAYALNVRMGPSTANPIIRTIRSGDVVPVYRVYGNWGRINNRECEWIHLGWSKPYEGA